jgi:AraC-like DNA-binding protein
VSYRVFFPSDELKKFVKTFSISENDEANDYKILPGTSIVMGFQYSGKLSYKNENEVIPLSAAGVTGLNDTFRVFSNSNNTHTFLVMFSETGAGAFFNSPMHELFGQSYSLDDLVLRSQMDIVLEELNESETDIERVKVIERFLISRINYEATDEMVTLAVELIKQYAGNIKITLLAEKLNISQSQLEKRFRKIVGASPKKFANIVRLRNVIDSVHNENTMTRVGLEAGYFDQAHFIKDFKSFTGLTPENYFREI